MRSESPLPAGSRSKTLTFGAMAAMLSVAILLMVAEIVLRFLPVSSGLRTQPVTADNPVFRLPPNGALTFSRDWDFKLANVRRVNNAGWVNDQDYSQDGAPPLLAVVGDSYIEAAMVPYPETIYARLSEALRGKLRVYSFGVSGAPLSQYLAWAQHAVRDYGAKALVINIVGNDFDESHIRYLTGPGWWIYAPGSDGRLRLRLVEYRPGIAQPLVYNSALARYLFFNLQLTNTWRDLMHLVFGGPANAAPQYAGNTAASVNAARLELSHAIVDAFLRDLLEMTGLPPERILFTLDGFRYADAVPKDETYFNTMRQTFIAKARSLRYEAIDLDPWFFADFKKRQQRFEYPNDGHWNGLGHELAARAVLASDMLRRLESGP